MHYAYDLTKSLVRASSAYVFMSVRYFVARWRHANAETIARQTLPVDSEVT